MPRVTSFGVHKTPLMEVDRESIAKTCPEAAASVWRGCQVEMYQEFRHLPKEELWRRAPGEVEIGASSLRKTH